VVVLNNSTSSSLLATLGSRAASAGEWVSHRSKATLARFWVKAVPARFPVSSAGALTLGMLVGLCSGAVCWMMVLHHGDLVLGALQESDAETVVLNGHIYDVRGGIKATASVRVTPAPLVVTTSYRPQLAFETWIPGLDDLIASNSSRPLPTRD